MACTKKKLITEGSNGGIDFLDGISLGLNSLLLDGSESSLTLVVSSRLGLTLLFELGNNILVLPTDFVRDTTNGGVLTSGLKTEDTESGGDNHALNTVIRSGNTFEKLNAIQSSGTTSSLVGNHTTDSLIQDTRRSTEMERTTSGVDETTLVEVSVVLHYINYTTQYINKQLQLEKICLNNYMPFSPRVKNIEKQPSFMFSLDGQNSQNYLLQKKYKAPHTLVTEEFTRNVQSFASDNNNLLAIEGLLGNDGSKTT
jgi:hypothetical protein